MAPGEAEGEVALVRASTALALRTPAASRHAPSFFPTGHSDSWKLLTVVFGAPVAMAVAVATMTSGLGVASILLGAVAAPLGSLGADHWFQERGKPRLRKANALYLLDPERGLLALEQIALSNALPEVRLEAAARIAIHALGVGNVARAIEVLSLREQDLDTPRRRRSWSAGLRAEVLRAILAWLSPDSFTDSGIAPSGAFRDEGADAEGLALLAVLRLLERASDQDDGTLAAAWSDIQATELEATLPSLYVIALAITAERLPHLLEELHDRLRKDQSGVHHALLRSLFPRMQILVDGGYRQMLPEDPIEGAVTSLAVVAPATLQALALPTEAELQPVTRSAAGVAFAGTYGAIVLGSWVLGMLAGGPAILGIGIGLLMSMYVGTPIAAIWGSHRKQRFERERRVAPLSRLDPPPPAAWLTECASGPPGVVTRTSGYRRLTDLPPSQLVLHVAAMKAEQALARGDVEGAWEQLEWWFSGFSGKLASADPLYAVGSSLVRVAALAGRQAMAHRLLAVMPEMGNPWDGPESRTIYGNAPRAVSLASALVYALDEQWEAVATQLRRAREAPAVFMTPRDHALVIEIVRRGAKAKVALEWRIPKDVSTQRAWVDSIWPQSTG